MLDASNSRSLLKDVHMHRGMNVQNDTIFREEGLALLIRHNYPLVVLIIPQITQEEKIIAYIIKSDKAE